MAQLMHHDEPHIGKPVPYALEYLREFQQLDAKIILWTMRSEMMNGQNHIDIAVNYLTMLTLNNFHGPQVLKFMLT